MTFVQTMLAKGDDLSKPYDWVWKTLWVAYQQVEQPTKEQTYQVSHESVSDRCAPYRHADAHVRPIYHIVPP